MADQRAAIVTGASRGIGRAIAVRLARSGYRLALLARNAAALAETIKACAAAAAEAPDDSAGGAQPEPKRRRTAEAADPCDTRESADFLPCAVDLRNRERVKEVIDGAAAALGGVSVLVCNAGVLLSASAVSGDPARWEEELDVNVKGSMAATRATLPHILESKAATKAVIFIGSTGSQWSFPYCGGYCASKHALRGFAGSVFPEVRDKGVKVCMIMPGFTDTDMIASNKGMVKDKLIRPDDVAHAVECVLGFPPSACPTEMLIRPQYDCTDGTVPYTIV
mmetsp:Transcript_80776/g.249195  ORF Transcript_80776/g.249195 Transcript_80776/m.249195 type:complete len:280 (-) Transcript_80776:8-847(-)